MTYITDGRSAADLVGDGPVSLSLVFPCPKCGHANRPARRKLDSLKLYLQDKLPPCRKCGWQLRQRYYDCSTAPKPLLRQAMKELGLKQEPAGAAKDRKRWRSRAGFIVDMNGVVRCR
jgi:hypothetical protein